MSDDKKKVEEQLELDFGDDVETELDAEEDTVVVEEDEPQDEDVVVEKTGVSVEDGITELKAQLEKERQARIEAENRAKEAAVLARRAKLEVDDTNLHLVNSAITEVKRENAWYKSAIREALEKGDYDRVTEFQEAMLVNVHKLNKLEEGKVAMESRPRQEEYSSADPVEMFASQLSARSADWVRRNPQFVTDPRLQQKMIAAHNLAVADGYAPDSDDYFSFIEDTLRMNRREPPRALSLDQEEDSALSSASKPTQRRSAPPAAPVSRTSTAPSGNRSRPNEVRLTKDQIEAARISGVTPQEYYAQMQKEKRRSDGRYN